MKKIYILFLICVIGLSSNAQYILTNSSMPLPGDIEKTTYLDNTTALHIGSTGTAQVWNYAAITSSLGSLSNGTYTPMSSVPYSSMFPTGTIGLTGGGGNYDVYNFNSKKEMVGWASNTYTDCLNMPNSLIYFTLPFAYGNTYSDSFQFTQYGDSYTGTSTTTADGSGTLIMPTYTFTNVLRLKQVMSYTVTGSSPFTITSTDYEYYSAINKFPLLAINMNTYTSGTVTSTSKSGTANSYFFTGLTELENKPVFAVFPNPVTDKKVTINFNSKENDNVSISIYNNLGQEVESRVIAPSASSDHKTILDLSDLTNGIYYMKLKTLSGEIHTQKLIIQ